MCIVKSLLLIECEVRTFHGDMEMDHIKKEQLMLHQIIDLLNMASLSWMFVFVCLSDPALTCTCTHLCASSTLHIYVSFYARVGVWMSVCMSLCCHICCYQGNPVGRRRSAERCTAWRRETCGAQPVAGKKPVRDSPTNPVPFPRSWDELFLTRSDS